MIPGPEFADQQSGELMFGAGILAVLTFLTLVSERAQKMLGPLGKWIREKRLRDIERQSELEAALTEQHERRFNDLQEHIDFYRTRWLEARKEADRWRREADECRNEKNRNGD